MPLKQAHLEESFIAFAKPSFGCAWISPYARSPKINILQNLTFQSYLFEKKLCRAAFKQNFGLKLPAAADITMAMALFNSTPRFKSANYNGVKHQTHFIHTVVPTPRNNQSKCHFYASRKLNQATFEPTRPLETNIALKSRFKTMWTCSGLQLLSAAWACDQLIQSLNQRRNPKVTLNRFIRDVKALMNQWQSACPLKGLRVTATGRFSKRKKNMAQQISLSTGKVPLSTLKEKIDYSQGFVKTKLGTVGLKVWLCSR